MQHPLFSALDTLAINDRDCRTDLAAALLATQHVERVVDALQRPIIIPATKIVVDRAARRQVFRQRRPLTTGGEDIHDPVHNRSHVNRSSVATTFGARDHWADHSPLFVRQVARIAQLATVISGTILLRPHQRSVPQANNQHASQAIQLTRNVLGRTLSDDHLRTVHNETVKLNATYLNSLSVWFAGAGSIGALTATFLAPLHN
jgi:hypothetical protein